MTNGSAGAALALCLAACLVASTAGAAEPVWRLEQPAPPPGAPFKLPLGTPGDLRFFAPNRGLLTIEGNDAVPRGILSYDGVGWRRLASVCGGSGDTARIAFAGPREFWVISEPSRPRVGSGTALCRFKDGQVVGSFSTPAESSDPFHQMFAAACTGANDCWFGGVGAQDPLGERVGAFHLHWNGSQLETVYGPQGRAVSDLEAHGGKLYESTLVGAQPESPSAADLAEPETPAPRLIHMIAGGTFSIDPFTPLEQPGVPADGTELLALDSDGAQLWAVGGGAASGPSAPEEGSVQRPPLAARLGPAGFAELPLSGASFGLSERFTDVAAVSGTSSAWVTVVPFADRRNPNAKAKVALIGADGTASVIRLPVSGAGRGAAARIACTAPADCWMATYAGWLFHLTDGTAYPRDTDPAYAGGISFRPNEAAEQFVPDAPPVDDSRLFAPPPLELDPNAEQPAPRVRRLPALIKRVRTRLRGMRLTVTFTLNRRARVALLAKRRGRVVARTRPRVLAPGRRSLTLRLNRRRYPTKLAFSAREVGRRR